MDHQDGHRSLVHYGCDPPDGRAVRVSHTPLEHGQGALGVTLPYRLGSRDACPPDRTTRSGGVAQRSHAK